MLFTDTDADARRLLQLLLGELGLPTDLDELDRQVAEDPSLLLEIKVRALKYLSDRSQL